MKNLVGKLQPGTCMLSELIKKVNWLEPPLCPLTICAPEHLTFDIYSHIFEYIILYQFVASADSMPASRLSCIRSGSWTIAPQMGHGLHRFQQSHKQYVWRKILHPFIDWHSTFWALKVFLCSNDLIKAATTECVLTWKYLARPIQHFHAHWAFQQFEECRLIHDAGQTHQN